MEQRGRGIHGVEFALGIQLIEAENVHWNTQSFFSLCGNFWHSVSYMNVKSCGDHKFSFQPSPTTKFKNACAWAKER